MHFTFLMTLFTLFTAAFTAPHSAALASSDDALVTVDIHANIQSCEDPWSWPGTIYLNDTTCHEFGRNVEQLIVKQAMQGKIKYNSLRVYKNTNCTGYGDIEAVTCAWDREQPGCGCSNIKSYRSIRLVLE